MSYMDCFSDFDEPREAAECIHCLRKHGEQVYFDDELKRLVLGRELYDKTASEKMAELSSVLRIKDRKSYQDADEKYNLTMY